MRTVIMFGIFVTIVVVCGSVYLVQAAIINVTRQDGDLKRDCNNGAYVCEQDADANH